MTTDATPITRADLDRVEKKVDKLLSAMGLTDNRPLARSEIQEMAKGDVLKFNLKRNRSGRPPCLPVKANK